MKAQESGMDVLRKETKPEVKWVYTMSVPREESEPNIQIVIGIPQNSTTTGWFLPDGLAERNLNYQIDVPLNIIIGNQTFECIAKGEVTGNIVGNKFNLIGILAKDNLPEGAEDSVAKAYERLLDPKKNRTVSDTVGQEIETQCRNYFNERRAEKGVAN